MTWSNAEISDYKQLGDPILYDLYAKAGIPKTKPEERARFLGEDVLGDGLTMTDHDLISRKAAKDGKPAALNLSEEIAISTQSDSTK
ncbi:hypothetical protein CMI42_04045 [Candidatus Pacearchaeota archaeon]|jgi:hypothetical protein|nr:hypothetical protein [Candidatus Pacearchaeota archaeon]|tara:strand:+ start:2798 stop:3058 length:261 start_codon:yes stop_codon:yes gene_type:complete